MRSSAESQALFEKAQQWIPGGVNSPVRAFRAVGGNPFFAVRASGATVWDSDDNEYIDYVGTWGPAILGHAPRVVVEAVQNAAEHGTSFGIPNPLEVRMPELHIRTFSTDGTALTTNSAMRTSSGFGMPKLVPCSAAFCTASTTTLGACPKIAGPQVPT
jgi:glutamate-1-semialdehyde 2,1-aminomutase